MITCLLQGQDESSEADPLDIKNCEGCFWVTIYGTIFSAGLVLFEYIIYLIKVTLKAKLPFIEVFKREIKVYLDFNSESKPVLTKEDASSEEKSKSESAKESEKSKTTSKSTLRSRSMSPRRRMSKSKSARRASHSKSISKSNGNKSPLPYGFIFSRSTERLQSTP